MAVAVGVALSPSAGLAIADPIEPTIPVIPMPEPPPAESSPAQGEAPAPPILEIPAEQPALPVSPIPNLAPPMEQPPAPIPVQELPPAPEIQVPKPPSVEAPSVPVPGPSIVTPPTQEVPRVLPDQGQTMEPPPPPIRESVPDIGQSEPDAPPLPTEEAPPSTPSSVEQPDPQESDLPTTGEVQLPQPPEVLPRGDESPAESEPPPPLSGSQDDMPESQTTPTDSIEATVDPSLPGGSQPDSRDIFATEPIEVPKPDEGPRPVPEEFLEQEPVTVAAEDAGKDWRRGPSDKGDHHGDKDRPRPPKPGKDHPKNPWKHDRVDRFPDSADIDIKGDEDNSVTVINHITNITQIDNSVTNNINIVNVDVTKIENRQDWLYLRNFEYPHKVLRVPVRYGHPVRLNPGWCGGVGGAWSFSAAVTGSNLAASFAGSGVFYANSGCGYAPPPPLPPRYPKHLYICPPRGYHGPPVYQGNYRFISRTTVYAPEFNTYYYGSWETRNVNQKPQKVFVPTGWSPDTVFQQEPIPGPPPPIKNRWGGYESSEPSGIMAAAQYARDHKPISIAVAVLIGAAAVWGATSLARNRKRSSP